MDCRPTEREGQECHSLASWDEWKERRKAWKEFDSGKFKILVCADALIDYVQHSYSSVINYDLPRKKEDYIQRCGLDRIGQRVYINFSKREEIKLIEEIESSTRSKLKNFLINLWRYIIFGERVLHSFFLVEVCKN